MKLINKTTTKYLEELKVKAIGDYNYNLKENIKSGIRLIPFFTVGTIVFLVLMIYSLNDGFDFSTFFTIFLTFLFGGADGAMIGDVIMDCKKSKEELTEERKIEIQEEDCNVKGFRENLRDYEYLEKVEIVGYFKDVENDNIHIEYADENGIIEKKVVYAKLKMKKDIKEPELVLTNEEFVFYEPYMSSAN